MNAINKFTTAEKDKLRRCMKNGGVFLKLSENLNANIKVQVTNGGYNVITDTLDEQISAKIYYLYKNQNTYRGLFKDGSICLSISWFIAAYC